MADAKNINGMINYNNCVTEMSGSGHVYVRYAIVGELGEHNCNPKRDRSFRPGTVWAVGKISYIIDYRGIPDMPSEQTIKMWL